MRYQRKSVCFLAFDERVGLTYHFVDWVEALAKTCSERFKLMVVTTPKEQNPGLKKRLSKIPDISVYEISRSVDLPSISELRHASLIHCHGFRQLRMLQKDSLRTASTKLVLTLHSFRNGSWQKHFFANAVSLLLLNEPRTFVHFLSANARTEFLQWNLIYKRQKLSWTFMLGCNLDEFNSPVSPKVLDGPYIEMATTSRPQLVYLASFHPGKQHLSLLDAIGNTLQKHNGILWLLGDGPARRTVEQTIKRAELADFVRCPGRLPRQDVPWILSHMQVAVCSSRSETFAHCIIEPLCAGVPIVTTNVGSASNLIRDFDNGFVIHGMPCEKNFGRSVDLLLSDQGLARKMGARAREDAQRLLTWSKCAFKTAEMYSTMLKTDRLQSLSQWQ